MKRFLGSNFNAVILALLVMTVIVANVPSASAQEDRSRPRRVRPNESAINNDPSGEPSNQQNDEQSPDQAAAKPAAQSSKPAKERRTAVTVERKKRHGKVHRASVKVAHGTARGAKATAHGAKVGAKATAHGAKVGAKATAHGTKAAAKATARGTKKTGKAIAGTFK